MTATTCGYYRTSSRVTARPIIMRWISLVPSKMGAGFWALGRQHVREVADFLLEGNRPRFDIMVSEHD
jgi:hypothetical protein